MGFVAKKEDGHLDNLTREASVATALTGGDERSVFHSVIKTELTESSVISEAMKPFDHAIQSGSLDAIPNDLRGEWRATTERGG